MPRIAILLLFVTVVGCGQRGVIVDKPDQVTFDGRTYLGLVPSAVNVDDESAAPVGTASSIVGRVRDPSVFALAGVDPARAVAMRLDGGGYMAFLAESSPGNVPLLSDIPGMCQYAVSEPGC
jgi:hypothetical protein